MPTFLAGKDNKVLFGAFDLSSYFNSASFSREQAVSETTTFGSEVKQPIFNQLRQQQLLLVDF